MLPNQTIRYGDLLKEFYQGLKDGTLQETRMAEIQRVFNEFSDREARYRSWLLSPDRLDFKSRIHGTQADFDVSAARGVNYTSITNGTIADSTYVDLAFSSSYGYVEFTDVCMIWKPGYTDRFIRNPTLPTKTNIMCIATVEFDVGGASAAAFGLYVDSYIGGSYYGSFYGDGNYNPSNYNWQNQICVAHDSLDDNEEYRINVYQDTGAPMTLIDANVSFFIA